MNLKDNITWCQECGDKFEVDRVKEALLEFQKIFNEYILIMNNNCFLESHLKMRKEVENWIKLNNIKYDNFNKCIMGYVLEVKFKEIFGDFEATSGKEENEP